MQDKLIVFFAADGTPSWVTVGQDGQPAGRVLSGEADQLTMAAAGKEVIAVVPSEDVLLTSAVLPKLSRSRLLQALPYAIEDQLTSDVEELHFVPADRQVEGVTPIAVVSLEKMHQWRQQLQSWRVQPVRLVPSIFMLPLEEAAWHVTVTDMAVVRTGELSGFSCEVPQLNDWLSIAIASAAKKPQRIYIHNYTPKEITSSLKALLAMTGMEVVEDRLPPDQWYQDAARQVNTPAINLLSGSFAARKTTFTRLAKVRKMLSYLALAWVILLLLYPTVSYVLLKTRLSSIQGQMWQLYKKQFPQATSMVAPKIRFEEKLHKTGSSLGQNRFLLLLGYVGEAMHKTTDVTIKRMVFQGGLLTLDVTANNEKFAAFTDYLSQQGLQVKEQNANVSGDHVSATVQVE